MSGLDWGVLLVTILGIAAYGTWLGRARSTAGYLKGEALRWPTIGLSIMATQASAITFLSTPGQAYDDGMRFVQMYFGLPLATVLVSLFFVPVFHRAKVFTAYEYLEGRFDVRVRVLAATLFLIGRGLAAGITIYAPAILLSSVLGVPLYVLNAFLGGVVIVYTVTGGANAVAQTQRQQMAVILAGIFVAAAILVWQLPPHVGVAEAARVAGAVGRMNIVDFRFDPTTRYTFWSGITGGLFLQLSYFGTDQSQVQRYLGGASTAQSRLGLLFNGLFKIPMQFSILFIGILVFVFYVFTKPPVFFDEASLERARGADPAGVAAIEARWDAAFEERRAGADAFLAADTAETRARLAAAQDAVTATRAEAQKVIAAGAPGAPSKDSDYIFVTFVLDRLPQGVVGLLIAVIFLASMSSTASELSALGATSAVDLYKRLVRPDADERHMWRAGQALTVLWGVGAVSFAMFASLVDNLIQAVNILGSLFYGVILGIFLVGFTTRVGGTATFVAALAAEATVLALYATTDIGFLWFNAIGCGLVVGGAVAAHAINGAAPWEERS